jgi:hypothetical protein
MIPQNLAPAPRQKANHTKNLSNNEKQLKKSHQYPENL